MARPRTRKGVLSVDPFEVAMRPTPAQKVWAEWFQKITKDIPSDQKYHIRRIHYRAFTTGTLKPDGRPYENTDSDTALLSRASEYARYLGLVDIDRIEDHKNLGETVQVIYEPDDVSTDFSIKPKSFIHPNIEDAEDVIESYSSGRIEYGVAIRRPYHLEIWVEKSTMNDILIPIANKFGATLMVGGGQFSLTNCKELFDRIKDLNKPVRVFYLRDFDPGGSSMPTAVARKTEWFIRTKRPAIDLRLYDVALTRAQCVKYDLPRTPIKSKNKKDTKYKDTWEKRNGEGATELDALEALHPGELANILTKSMSPYYDESLEEEVSDFEATETDRFDQYQEETITETVMEKGADLEPLIEQYNELIGKVNEVGTQIEELMRPACKDYEFEPEYPDASSLVVDEETPLLDTTISFEEQLDRYWGAKEGKKDD